MNRTALSVIALAVGSVLIIALFNVYKPAVNHLSHDVFDKVRIGRMAGTKGPSIDQQARDHNINPNNPQRPSQLGYDPTTYFDYNVPVYYKYGIKGGGFDEVKAQPWKYVWHKKEVNGFLGYWKPQKGKSYYSFDQDRLKITEHQGDASYMYYEKPDGSVVQGRWNSNEA